MEQTNLDIVDIDGAVNMATTALVTGVLTTTATQVATGGITSGSDIISDTDSTDSLGSTGVRWLKGWFDTLTAGTLTVGSGSVTDSSGAISFGDENLTTTGIVTAAGTSVFTNLDISGDIDVDGTTNLDVVDIDGAVDMASTLQVDSAATFSSTVNTNNDVVIAKSSTGVPSLTLSGFAGINSPYSIINFYNADASQQGPNNAAQIKALVINTDGSGGSLAFHTSTGTGTEGADATKKVTIGGGGAFTTFPSVGQPAAFNEDGVDADFRVESDGNANMLFVDGGANTVGIGTGSPIAPLQITTAITGTPASTVAAGTNAGIYLEDDDSPTDYFFVSKIHNPGNNLAVGGIKFAVSPDGTNYNWSGIQALTVSSGNCGTLAFYTSADNTSANSSTERMRIDVSGNLLVGATSTAAVTTPTTDGIYLSYNGVVHTARNSASTSNHHVFINANGEVGTISTNGSATTYATSSDYRLKEDDVPMTGATERVKALRPINFAWKIDGSRVDGFLAHEVQDIVPEAVTGEKDAVDDEEYEVTPAVEEVRDEDGNVTTEAVAAVMGTRSVPDYQGIDQSKLVPLLTAALQEAITQIESLTARITALEE
jgi:hypothetical protein